MNSQSHRNLQISLKVWSIWKNESKFLKFVWQVKEFKRCVEKKKKTTNPLKQSINLTRLDDSLFWLVDGCIDFLVESFEAFLDVKKLMTKVVDNNQKIKIKAIKSGWIKTSGSEEVVRVQFRRLELLEFLTIESW